MSDKEFELLESVYIPPQHMDRLTASQARSELQTMEENERLRQEKAKTQQESEQLEPGSPEQPQETPKTEDLTLLEKALLERLGKEQ